MSFIFLKLPSKKSNKFARQPGTLDFRHLPVYSHQITSIDFEDDSVGGGRVAIQNIGSSNIYYTFGIYTEEEPIPVPCVDADDYSKMGGFALMPGDMVVFNFPNSEGVAGFRCVCNPGEESVVSFIDSSF